MNILSFLLTAHQLSEFKSRPKTCKDVKLHDRSYVPNGENRIYPLRDCSISVKVYCYDTENADPKEYVTVGEGNIVKDWRGTTEFQKVFLFYHFTFIEFAQVRL